MPVITEKNTTSIGENALKLDKENEQNQINNSFMLHGLFICLETPVSISWLWVICVNPQNTPKSMLKIERKLFVPESTYKRRQQDRGGR